MDRERAVSFLLTNEVVDRMVESFGDNLVDAFHREVVIQTRWLIAALTALTAACAVVVRL